MDADWAKQLAEFGWQVTEEAEGVTRLQRVDDVVLLGGLPQVHVHRLKGQTKLIELCCHGCGTGVYVKYQPSTTFSMVRTKQMFLDRHRGCPNAGGELLCPLARTHTYTIDLRQHDN